MSKKRYPLRVTRTAHGIRAQDLRTLVRTAWWARRWISALEAMRLGARLGRGRQYAVAGQVTELMLEGPHVEASVTGSRLDPYHVTLDFTSASGEPGIAAALRAEPILLARLLTDDLPTEVEELFRLEGVPLFPKVEPLGKTAEGKAIWDVRMQCSCPDWARPCKHIAAVLLLLGEEVARHPSTLLSLRGVDVDDLVPPDESPREPLAQDDGILEINGAWTSRSVELQGTGDEAAPLIRRLGAVPFWRGEARCVDALAKIYGRVRPLAIEAAEGKSVDLR